MRHALTRALAEYEGSLVVVSHDRALLRTVCDGFILVADGRAVEFDGDVDDYLAWLAARRASAGAAAIAATAVNGREERRTQRELATAERQARIAKRRPLVKEAERLEKTIAALEAEKRELEQKLGDTGFYANTAPAHVHAASRRCAEVAQELGKAEERWLEVQCELEAIGVP
jgi:ATP-binding cassette subfamily F protein 3